MTNWVWGQISAFASLGVFAGFFVISLIFIFVLFPLTKRHYKDITTLDGNPWGFTVADAKATLGSMSEQQLRVYRMQELLTDLFFPLVYGLGFAVAMVLLVRYTGAPHWLVLLPLAAALADYVENLSVVLMIGRRLAGQEVGPMAGIGSVASRLKHFLLLITVLVLLGLCACGVWRRFH
jgi:predicted secreted protein